MTPPATIDPVKGWDEREHAILWSKRYPMWSPSRLDLAQILQVTGEEVRQLPHDRRGKPKWCAVNSPGPGVPRKPQVAPRRAKILELVRQFQDVPSSRDLAEWLRMNDFPVSHQTVNTDLKALGLKSRKAAGRRAKTDRLFH